MKTENIHVVPPVNIKATHNQQKFKRWCKKLGWTPTSKAHAETIFAIVSNEPVALVRMTENLDFSAAEDAALLSHEAVHVASGYFEFIGEDKPSEEFAAHVVQYISAYLIDWHFKWKKRKLNMRE